MESGEEEEFAQFNLPKGQGAEKLNMEELKDQHRKLTEMIAASKQKVLEDRLSRTRDPPPSTI